MSVVKPVDRVDQVDLAYQSRRARHPKTKVLALLGVAALVSFVVFFSLPADAIYAIFDHLPEPPAWLLKLTGSHY